MPTTQHAATPIAIWDPRPSPSSLVPPLPLPSPKWLFPLLSTAPELAPTLLEAVCDGVALVVMVDEEVGVGEGVVVVDGVPVPVTDTVMLGVGDAGVEDGVADGEGKMVGVAVGVLDAAAGERVAVTAVEADADAAAPAVLVALAPAMVETDGRGLEVCDPLAPVEPLAVGVLELVGVPEWEGEGDGEPPVSEKRMVPPSRTHP